MTLYGRFRRLKLDPAVLGLERRDGETRYFCTPVGAKIIGWAGVDGIHYCFIRRFGEMVFAVEPMGDVDSYVYPLARSFADFLRLLLTCGDAGLIQQAHAWDRARFDALLLENPITDAQAAALAHIAKAFELTPMDDPYGYIRAVYDDFDRSQIPFSADYYEWVPAEPKPAQPPAWKVHYHGGFWGHHGRDRAGTPIAIDLCAPWGGDTVHIPAVYACAAGLVADVCIAVDPERVRTFLARWEQIRDRERDLSDEERESLESANPLQVDFRLEVEVNGRTLRQKYGTSASWIPEALLPEGVQPEEKTRWILQHYSLSEELGWTIHRVSLPWATQCRPKALTQLYLRLLPDPQSLPGAHFSVTAPGETVAFTHPVTGAAHTLTVLEYEPQTVDFARDDAMEYPTHYVAMTYAVDPPLPPRGMQVMDCARGDRPRPRRREPGKPTAIGDVALIGIIGGADGPTALISGGTGQLQAAVSALHFEPVSAVEWRMVFRQTDRPVLTLDAPAGDMV